MPLNTFFDIHFPYGLERDLQNNWRAFNREYLPLGWHTKTDEGFKAEQTDQVSGSYPGLSEKNLISLASSPSSISYDNNGKVDKVMFYGELDNPKKSKANWNAYMDKLERLSQYKFDRKKTSANRNR